MTRAFHNIDPFLTPEGHARVEARIRNGGPYPTYVTAPIKTGIGAGLTRRHDAALAWVRRQLAAGSMESMEAQAARTNLFRSTWIERGARSSGCGEIADHSGLADAARALLGAEIVEPYMLYANLLLPGQELPVHHDTPEFAGLDKTVCPEWFLVVCGHSGLFEHRRIRVASAVVFVGGNGELIVYPDGIEHAPCTVAPKPNTAIVLDADELVHGVARVGGPEAAAPPAEVGMQLGWTGDRWALGRGDDTVAHYDAGDVRLSLQWKAWVFADAATQVATLSRPLTIDEATTTLVAELKRRGHDLEPMPDDTDLALLLIDTFIQLPTA